MRSLLCLLVTQNRYLHIWRFLCHEGETMKESSGNAAVVTGDPLLIARGGVSVTSAVGGLVELPVPISHGRMSYAISLCDDL